MKIVRAIIWAVAIFAALTIAAATVAQAIAMRDLEREFYFLRTRCCGGQEL